MKNAEILERVLARIPHPSQIKNLDLDGANEIRFDWRGTRYRVSQHWGVEEVQGHMLKGTDAAMLMSALLKVVPR